MSRSLYLNKLQLTAELDRCLNCPGKPCMSACPVSCNPQAFIQAMKKGDSAAAVANITRFNPMGQTCGLICPDKFCMKACTRAHIDFAVNIPKVQATILEQARTTPPVFVSSPRTGPKAAVIGAGPAGIAAAAEWVRLGGSVVLFEAKDRIGGALNLIPETRLPHAVIEKDWMFLKGREQIELRLNTPISAPESLLSQGFDAVIVATGEPVCQQLNIPGEEISLSYTDYLAHPEAYPATGNVAVIGGGNVAADCALTAVANGAAHVDMLIRRRLADMKITRTDCLTLIERGVNIMALTSPLRLTRAEDGLSLTLCKNQYTAGRLTHLSETEVTLRGYDLIIRAIGSTALPPAPHERLIDAGDCKTGGSTIVEALASGRNAARTLFARLPEKEAFGQT